MKKRIMKATTNAVPKHIGIILDGNRRFAKRLMMKPWKGHEWGAKKVEKLFEWCAELNIKELTLYALSVENFNRPKKEFDYLMNLCRKEFARYENHPKVEENKIRINVIGRTWMLPKDIQEMIGRITEKTKKHDRYIINFALAYGGRAEVIDATKKIAEQVKAGTLDIDKINEESFAKELYTADEPELVIRTGGERRTSNFLLWQSHYAEWMFLEKMWPEFDKKDLAACIDDFATRKRRFGR